MYSQSISTGTIPALHSFLLSEHQYARHHLKARHTVLISSYQQLSIDNAIDYYSQNTVLGYDRRRNYSNQVDWMSANEQYPCRDKVAWWSFYLDTGSD